MISSVYQYYLSAYSQPKVSRYDTHKKSELRRVYNNMVKINRKAPLYKINFSEDEQKFAIDLKESSRLFRNVILETAGDGDNAFQEKTAYSSDESVLTASFIGEDQAELEEGIQYQLEVKQLASAQINTGDFIPSGRLDLAPGQYSFDLAVGDTAYEFQFKVSDNTSNLELQEKLAKLINRSNIGVAAKVLKDDNGSSALQILSASTGFSSYRGLAFQISDNQSADSTGSVALFGLDRVSHAPSNAAVVINGIETTSASNSFSISRNFAVTLNNTTKPGESVQIGMRRSVDTILTSMSRLSESYNSLYTLAETHKNEGPAGNKLLRDLTFVTNRFQSTLESSGLMIREDGRLEPDEALVIQASKDNTLEENTEQIDHFRHALLRQLDQISLNPIEYINKKMIAYKNPVRSYTSPYQTSIYSGMILNGYV